MLVGHNAKATKCLIENTNIPQKYFKITSVWRPNFKDNSSKHIKIENRWKQFYEENHFRVKDEIRFKYSIFPTNCVVHVFKIKNNYK